MGAEIDRLEIEIESAAAKANKELDKLVSRLEKISGSLSKIDTNKLSGFSSGLGQYTSKTSSASRETDRISKSFSNFSKKITGSKKSFSQMAGSFYANAFPIIRGMKKLKSSIETSMDYVETYNYFSVTMDKIGREFGKNFNKYGYVSADSYANSFKDRMNELTRKMTGYNVGSNGELFMTDSIGLGLDPQVIQNYQASISAITNSVGLIGENSVNASKALTMLSADMSSLKNVDISTVMTNLQSGLIGQSRSLYKYGIDITNATLQTYAYKYGISMAVSEMTQADKMQLRLLAILDQSKVAWGDQARTINSVANQYRIFKQQVSNLARVIGNLFLPIVQKVLPVVNGLVIALQRLFNALGFKLWGGNWLKDTMEGIGGVGGGDALDELAGSAEDTADGLKDASKAAEKLKTMVRGIDELNIIRPDDSSNTGSSSGSIGSGIDLSGAIGSALEEYESVWEEAFKNAENKAQEYADKICNAFKHGDYEGIGRYISNGLTRGLQSINWNAVYASADNFGKALAEFHNGLTNPELYSEIGKTIASSINTALHFLNSYGKTFNWFEFGQSLSYSLKEFFKTWDAKLTGETLSTFAKGLLKSAKGAIDVLRGDKVFRDIGQKIVDLICGIDWKGVIWDLGGFFESLAAAMAQFPIDLAEGILQGIVDKIFGEGKFTVDFTLPKWAENASDLMGFANPNKSISSKLFSLFGLSNEWLNDWQKNNEKVRNDEKKSFDKFGTNVKKVFGTTGNYIYVNTSLTNKKSSNEFQNLRNNLCSDSNYVGLYIPEKFKDISSRISEEAANSKSYATSNFEEIRKNLTASSDNSRTNVQNNFSKIESTILEKSQGSSETSRLNFANIESNITSKTSLASSSVRTNFSNIESNITSKTDKSRNSTNLLIGKISELLGFDGRKMEIKLPTGPLDTFRSAASKVIDKLADLFRYNGKVVNVSASVHYSSNGSVHGGGGRAFASGGFPETGEVFLARENGLTEMVGRIGNRPAVANNDQIVEAITVGVANGINSEEQNALLREQNNLLRALLAKDTDIQIDGRSLVSGIETAKKRMGYNFQPA